MGLSAGTLAGNPASSGYRNSYDNRHITGIGATT